MLRPLFWLISKANRESSIAAFKKQLRSDTGWDYLDQPVQPLDEFLYEYDKSREVGCPSCKAITKGIFRCLRCSTLKPKDPLKALEEVNSEIHLLMMVTKDRAGAQEAEHRSGLLREPTDLTQHSLETLPDSAQKPSEKMCPFCAETIKWDAIVCRYCGRDLPAAPRT